jgi:choline dehydrogenase-like flavoprotein
MADYDAIVVGGGVGGATAAARLLEAGKRVLLLEAQDRWGGRTKLGTSSAAPPPPTPTPTPVRFVSHSFSTLYFSRHCVELYISTPSRRSGIRRGP